MRTCKTCGNKYNYPNKIYCSVKCKPKISRKFKPEWITAGRDFIREKIRARDNYTCQSCGRVWKQNERRFDVHHIDCDNLKTYQYDNLSKEADNLITLCHKCHLNYHSKKNMFVDNH
jgi:5-methylcytosine-specific restriction endonuclease McrA